MTLGIDVAAVDGNSGIDWRAAKNAGATFAYIKASQHLYPDTQHAESVKHARDAGLVVGAYHFPGWGPRAADAKRQVAAFKHAADITFGKDLPPCLDIEGFENCGWSSTQTVEFIRQLVLEVEDQIDVTPCLYTSYGQYDNLRRPSMPWAARCPAWIKTAYRLQARQPVDQVIPPTPHGGVSVHDPREYYRIPDPWGDQYWIQQFQGDALGFPGFNKTVDVNLFRTITAPLGDTLESGGHISWLQGKLGVTVDGTYGPVTEAAVRALQTQTGLPETGAVDPATFAAAAWL